MIDSIFTDLYSSSATVSVTQELIAVGIALLCGLIISFSYMVKSKYSKHFVITLVLLPPTIQVVIMLINGNLGTAVAIAGFVAGTYWFLMLVGRLISSVISGKVSARTQLTCVSATALLLIVLAISLGNAFSVKMPVFNGHGFEMAVVPIAALLLVLCGLCTSVMWGTIFDLAVEGLGSATEKASGIFMAMVVGGGIVPLLQNFIADKAGYLPSYWLIAACVAFILYFAVAGSKVKKA